MKRIPEPEHMTKEEEDHYALADYSIPHDALAKEIAETAKVGMNAVAIDLGCGPGDVLIRLRYKVKWSLVGLDLSENMLCFARDDAAKRLKVNEKRIAWVLADLKETGLPNSFADVIISNSVLHHILDPISFWQEVKRLARPGAYIFIRDLRRSQDEIEARQIIQANIPNESKVVRDHYFTSLCSSHTTEEVKEQLQQVGIKGLVVKPLYDRYLDVSGQIE